MTIPPITNNEEAGGEYRADLWQIVTDAKGFESIHETDEDGNPGDLVAHVFSDNAKLIVSAPILKKTLAQLLAIAGTPITERQESVFAEARSRPHPRIRSPEVSGAIAEGGCASRGAMVEVRCKSCKQPFMARVADRNRGWGKFCSKSCKAIKQTLALASGARPKNWKRHDGVSPMKHKVCHACGEPAVNGVYREDGSVEWGCTIHHAENTTHPFSSDALGQW